MHRRALPLLLIAFAIVAAVTLQTSRATFTSSRSSSASFESAACYDRATTQNGTATSSADGTTTVTISSVDPSKAFLLFSTRHSSNRPVASTLRGRLASATSLEFDRVTNESSPVTMTIEWSVVEYDCGVVVQRGAAVPATTSTNIAITPVPALAQAFVTWSKTVEDSDVLYNLNDPTIVDLSAVDTLSIRVGSGNPDHLIWWQVVAFTDPASIEVQRGTVALTGTALSTTASISAVDPARSFVLASPTASSTSPSIGSTLVRARLTDSTTVTIDRGAADLDLDDISWQVVELTDGSSVQAGSASFGSGATTVTATISAVSLSRSSAFASTHTGGGQNGGRTPYTADDVVGVAATTVALTSTTQVTLTRDSTVDTADIAWFVVTWGRP